MGVAGAAVWASCSSHAVMEPGSFQPCRQRLLPPGPLGDHGTCSPCPPCHVLPWYPAASEPFQRGGSSTPPVTLGFVGKSSGVCIPNDAPRCGH